MAPEDSHLVTITSNSSINPEDIVRRSFPPARRGIDEEAVHKYLVSLADDVRALLEREKELRRKLMEAERRAADPEIDEATLTRAVGIETAKILQTAHDAAREVVERAETRAKELTADADQLMARRIAEAEGAAEAILVAAEEEATSLRSSAFEEAETLREAARAEAESLSGSAADEAETLLESTKAKCQEMVREAFDLRTTVLRDLADKRKSLFVQLEQLRSGRDSLVEVVDAVGDAVDDLRDRLANAEHDARVAAAEAGERAETVDDADLELELAVDEGLAVEFGSVRVLSREEAAPVVRPGPGLANDTVEEQGEASAETRRSVDELFAKIRSTRTGILGLEEADELLSEGQEADELLSEGQEAEQLEGDAALLARRAELLAPVNTKLKRAVKRALQDDQNELLDAIRNAAGAPDLEKLLPESVQVERFSLAFEPILVDALAAGSGWLNGADTEDVPAEAGQALAKELASELSSQLRHRLSDSFAGATDVGETAVHDGAGAAYREWKTPRIDDIAGDFAVLAFNRAAVANAAGVKARWVVDDSGKACPDCDDNALAGPQPVGEAFPTGQMHPPVHPGCRCLLVAAE